MSQVPVKTGTDGKAKLLVLLLAFAWGFNWLATPFALTEVPVWSVRFAGSGLGAVTLFTAALLTGYSLKVPRGEIPHVMVAGLLNVTGFQIFSALAQMNGATSRAVMIAYTMPIWATLLSCALLGERLTKIRLVAFALCVAGISILLWPLLSDGVPRFVLYSLGCALVWAGATVYQRWMKVTVPPLANAAWQLAFGFAFIAAGTFLVEGYPHLWPINSRPLFALVYIGVFGVGLAHFLWWAIVGRLPTITASIGSLLVPVVGVVGSTVILGERPTGSDIVGFILIFSAAACVLLTPTVKHVEMPE
jgi:drug/metabolite transporter (DMT)-like permease